MDGAWASTVLKLVGVTGFTNYIRVIRPFGANATLRAALFKIAHGDFVNLCYGSKLCRPNFRIKGSGSV